MQVFPIEKCQVVWSKDSKFEADRQAILRELRKMSVELQEAIDFTIKLSNRKPNEIKYWLETGAEVDYTLSIYFDDHAAAWGILIERMGTETSGGYVVGEVACLDPLTLSFIEKENILATEPLISK